jgi:hypothetical protein
VGRWHGFVDESSRQGYLVCAVVLAPEDLALTRRELKALCLPGQQRIHMKSEGASRRRAILSAVARMQVQALMYEVPAGRRSERAARDDCLRRLVPDLLRLEVGRLMIESCDQNHQDVQVVSDAVAKAGAHDSLQYLHGRPGIEPLLWLPDILAWAYGRGGDWFRRTGDVVREINRLDP